MPIVNATKKWDIPLEFSVNDESYKALGKIELFLQDDGNYTGRFEANKAINVDQILTTLTNLKPNSLYSVRSGDVFSSNKVR
jgi:hypothetical protein